MNDIDKDTLAVARLEERLGSLEYRMKELLTQFNSLAKLHSDFAKLNVQVTELCKRVEKQGSRGWEFAKTALAIAFGLANGLIILVLRELMR